MSATFRFLLTVAGFGGEMAEHAARWILARSTRSGRVQRQLARLEASGRISAADAGALDERLLRLTETARLDLLGGVDPEVQWSRPWDGLWRIVAFDVPEARTALRTRLRRRLHEHKFGWLQNSVWINPHPVDLFQEVAGEDGIDPESLVYFDAQPRGGENQAALVNGAWDFARLAKDYAGYMEILRIRPKRGGTGATAWFRWLEAEHRAWRQIARRDPFLPAMLLPRGYLGQRAWAARKEAFCGFAEAMRAEMEP
jgi:DNA-binding transcriptional regulator PaaX